MADAMSEALRAHLEGGVTTVCRCWLVTRRDGTQLGFTDHDDDLWFESVRFEASSGFAASALEETTGLAVNNTEAVGALSDAAITEADIAAGRFDGASVTLWHVNWRNTGERAIRFRGSLGEVSRKDEAFSAELRGLTEVLNQPRGRVFHRDCSCVLGDTKCTFDTLGPGYCTEQPVASVEDARVFRVGNAVAFEPQWFERGRLTVLNGTGEGLCGWIKSDRIVGSAREITLWHSLRSDIVAGDVLRLEAGCDKRAATCAAKFGNFLNYRGFPHIPGEDWLTSYPGSGKKHDGGSMNAPIVS